MQRRRQASGETVKCDCHATADGRHHQGQHRHRRHRLEHSRPDLRAQAAQRSIRSPGTRPFRPAPSCRRTSIRRRTSSSTCSRAASTWCSTARTSSATAGDLIRLPMGIPHGIFNKSDQPMKCLFWVTPTRKLYDLFWAIHSHEGAEARRGRGALGQARGRCSCRRRRRDVPSRSASGPRRRVGSGMQHRATGHAALPPAGSPALRKARGRGIAAHDRLALLERQHVVDIGEAVRRALPRPRRSRPPARRCGSCARSARSAAAAPARRPRAPAPDARRRTSRSARQRASRIACEAPFEPTGYIGCAASPSSVTRPCDQRGSGSRSHIGYSQNSGVASISACAST